MKISDSEEYFLITNQAINQDAFKKRYSNRISQQKKKEIKFKQLFYQIYFISQRYNNNKNKKTNEIYNNIEFLDYDLNYII